MDRQRCGGMIYGGFSKEAAMVVVVVVVDLLFI